MDLLSVVTGIGAAFAVGLAQKIAGYWVDSWEARQERRKRLVQDWREMVRDVWRNGRILRRMIDLDNEDGDEDEYRRLEQELDPKYHLLNFPLVGEMLRCDERYYSLRNRMGEQERREVEEADQLAEGTRFPEGLSILSDEIDRIEAEWGLLSGGRRLGRSGAWWGLRGLVTTK